MMITLGELRVLIREELSRSESVRVRQDPDDLKRNIALRARYGGLEGLVVARFDGPIGLYRVIDEKEHEDIMRTGMITGGKFAVGAEREVGASWGSNLDQVIAFGLQWKRNGRLKGQLRVLKINGYDRQFAHIAPGLDGEHELPSDARMAISACSTGLGCSVADVSVDDVVRSWMLDDAGKLIETVL